MAKAKSVHKTGRADPPVLAPAGGIVLRLYVAGNAPNSLIALGNLRAMCDAHFTGCHEIQVIDLLRDPQQAFADGIIVTPTLLKLSPGPLQRVAGNLNNRAQVLCALVNT